MGGERLPLVEQIGAGLAEPGLGRAGARKASAIHRSQSSGRAKRAWRSAARRSPTCVSSDARLNRWNWAINRRMRSAILGRLGTSTK